MIINILCFVYWHTFFTAAWFVERQSAVREVESLQTCNTHTNLYIALYCILLYCVVLNCIGLLIYCYVDIIRYNAMHKFVRALDNPQVEGSSPRPDRHSGS